LFPTPNSASPYHRLEGLQVPRDGLYEIGRWRLSDNLYRLLQASSVDMGYIRFIHVILGRLESARCHGVGDDNVIHLLPLTVPSGKVLRPGRLSRRLKPASFELTM